MSYVSRLLVGGAKHFSWFRKMPRPYWLVILLSALVACVAPTPTPEPTRVPPRPLAPTATPTLIPTRIPPTATQVPTATSAPTVTPSPIPTRPTYKIGAALPKRNAPRTLLDAQDFARIKSWVEKFAWARDARDQLIRNADAYPARYLQKYNLKSPDLPPMGGQWSLWYICPDGLRLRYEPTHTPPHFCPSDGKYYAAPTFTNRPALYDEVVYQNRHMDLADSARDLGLAFQLTGTKKYADNAAAILRAYASAYPNYAQHDKDGGKARSGGKATAQTLDEAQWLINLAWAYDLIFDSLTPAERTSIANNVLRPAVANIQGNRAKLSNWQTWHNAAIAMTGFALEDEKLVADAYTDPENGFQVQIMQGAANDGFWWEGAWGYHFFTLQPMLYLAELGERVGIAAYTQPNLRAMLTAPLTMAMPDGSLPPFNDDSGTTLTSREWLYEIGYNRYRDPAMLGVLRGTRDWRALLWGAENLASAPTQVLPSIALPQAGYAILRAGDDRYLALDFGAHGGGHGHFDKLGYVAFGLGRELALDPGTRSYAAAAHTTWDRATIAHNTIVVDEQNQLEATGNLQRFVGLPGFSLAIADAGAAYKTAAITRTLALTPDYWLDLTRVTSLDRAAHRFDWIYHNPGLLSTTYTLAPYTLPAKNGYEHLKNPQAVTTNDAWHATWEWSAVGERYGSVFNGREGIASSYTITRTNETFAGQLDYDFASVADGYAVYLTPNLTLPNETPTRIEARVFGDASNNRLLFRVMDATGEKFTKDFGALNWSGWQTMALNVDGSWNRGGAGNNDGVMDLPVSQVALQISRTTNGKRAGTLLADNLALTFASGRRVIEYFEKSLVRVDARMLGTPDTTVVFGTGMDERNAPIPFALARRQTLATTFAALFEPYRTTPHATVFEPLGPGVRVVAPNQFTDSILLPDGAGSSERLFGAFSTDATIAYVRQNPANQWQTLVVADATKFFADGIRAWFTSTAPTSAQFSLSGNTLAVTTETRGATLRVLAPNATQVTLNGKAIEHRREGEMLVVQVP